MKCVSVNIVMTYPVHWSKYQVLRDFVQNFYDAVGFEDWSQRFMYTYQDSVLSMWVDDVTFNYEWLMHIGASTKTSQSSGYEGFFGEGFKIASLCAFRDWGWTIHMMSGDWKINVTDIEQFIDHTPVRMLAYNITSVKKIEETKLILENFSAEDYKLFQIVMDSFFFPDNPIMGEKLWQGVEGAVFLRSKTPINKFLPSTSDFGKRGEVFCGYQMLGTNPFDLVVCLHNYRREDREGRSLYAFDVIKVFDERKIISNSRAAYHGMAVTHTKKQQLLNGMGIKIKYDIGKIYLKSEIFRKEGYYDGLATYIYEMCHMFGGDSSASFSQTLTFSTELLMENQEKVLNGKCKWENIFTF